MTNQTIMIRGFLGAAALLGFLLAPSAPAAAQATEGSWRAFTGCWVTLDVPQPPTVCVIPTADLTTVQIVTVADGAVVERETVEATGQRVTRAREGCTGWESAEWSADGKRLYMESEHRCDGGIERSSHGIMSILPGGDWLNVQGVEVAGNTGIRVLRHRATEAPAVVRNELAAAVLGREYALEAARVAIAAPVKLAEAIEVSHRLPEPVVEAWLIETEQNFEMDRAKLRQLAAADVPSAVIDVMVALSYPNVFAIDRDARRTQMQATQTAYAGAARPYGGVYSPWFGGYPYGFGLYPGFGYSRFYGGGYGYPGYGYPGYGWYPSRPTVIVIREPEQPAAPPARLVRGRGYTQGASTGNSGAATRSTGSSNSGGSAAPASSGSSSSGSSSGTSSGGGRTAQPRQ